MTAFVPSVHGWAFPNWYPPGTPVMEIPTPFGRIPVGDAHHGVCGGMVFAAMDLFARGRLPGREPTPELVKYFGRRLLDSWNLPFGILKYYDLQCRPQASTFAAGVRVRPGAMATCVEADWPRVRAELDAGQLVALGVVKASSFDPRHLGRNHQVLAFDYAEAGGGVTVRVYDPNYAGDDAVTLSFRPADADAGGAIRHSCEGETVRAIFATEYRRLPDGEPPGS